MRAVPQAEEMINLPTTAFQPLFCPIDLINRDPGYLILTPRMNRCVRYGGAVVSPHCSGTMGTPDN